MLIIKKIFKDFILKRILEEHSGKTKIIGFLIVYFIIFSLTKSYIVIPLFVICTLYLCFYGQPIFDGIVPLKKKINGLNSILQNAINQLPSENHQEELKKNYKKIRQYFCNDKFFKHPWIEFREHLVEQKNKESTFFENSVQPKDFFTAAHLFRKQEINTRQLDSMSGILLGIGVLGTFVGLTLALMNLKNLENIKPLLDGTKVAFFTSLVGLGCSLLFNMILDNKMSSFYKLLHRFHSRLEKSFHFVTKEQLLVKQSKELVQQTSHLGNMDERIALKIGESMDKMEQKLQEQNLQFVQKMSESIQKMMQKLEEAVSQNNSHISQEFLSNLTEKLSHGMGDFAKEQREQVKSTLSALQNQMPKLLDDLQASQKQNQETTKELIEQLNSSQEESQKKINQSLMESVTGMKDQFSQITDNLKQGMEQTMARSSEKLENLLQNLGALNTDIITKVASSQSKISSLIEEAFKKLHIFTQELQITVSEVKNTASTSIKPLVEQFNQSVNQQSQIVDKNNQYTSTLNHLAQKLEDVNSSLFEMAKELPGYLKQMQDTNQECSKLWERYEKRFEEVDQSTEQLFKQTQEGFRGLSEKTNEYISSLYQQSTKVSQVFAQAVENLKDNIEELQEKQVIFPQTEGEQFVKSVGQFNEAVGQLTKLIDKFPQKTDSQVA